jgi:hypothetical protein
MWTTLISNVLGLLGKLLPFVAAYYQGIKAAKLKNAEKRIERTEKENEIEKANKRKSVDTLVNELRSKYTRGSK